MPTRGSPWTGRPEWLPETRAQGGVPWNPLISTLLFLMTAGEMAVHYMASVSKDNRTRSRVRTVMSPPFIVESSEGRADIRRRASPPTLMLIVVLVLISAATLMSLKGCNAIAVIAAVILVAILWDRFYRKKIQSRRSGLRSERG